MTAKLTSDEVRTELKRGPRRRHVRPPRRPSLRAAQRIATGAAAIALAIHGVRRGGFVGLATALVGGALLDRAITGMPPRRLHGQHGPSAVVARERSIKIDRAIVVDRPRAEVYAAWRRIDELPRLTRTDRLVVEPLSIERSRWTLATPGGTQLVWDAEVMNDEKGRVIAWRTLPGSDVAMTGAVRFENALGGRGTEVHVSLKYEPPGGRIGAAIARLAGTDAAALVQGALERFAETVEREGGAERIAVGG